MSWAHGRFGGLDCLGLVARLGVDVAQRRTVEIGLGPHLDRGLGRGQNALEVCTSGQRGVTSYPLVPR